MHAFDDSQDSVSRLQRLKSEHRFRDSFGDTVVLFNNVVEVLDLPNKKRHFL